MGYSATVYNYCNIVDACLHQRTQTLVLEQRENFTEKYVVWVHKN
jgi:hypothetical protein